MNNADDNFMDENEEESQSSNSTPISLEEEQKNDGIFLTENQQEF